MWVRVYKYITHNYDLNVKCMVMSENHSIGLQGDVHDRHYFWIAAI